MECDDIVIGTGSRGAPMATRLSEDPDRRALLVEAGPDYPTFDATPDSVRYANRPPQDHGWGLEAEMVSGATYGW